MNQKAIDLADALSYQASCGVHTYGNCSKDGCNNTARGSAHCVSCVTKDLAKEVGQTTASSLRALYRDRARIQESINEIIGEF